MLRDVFYFGKKPNIHPRERLAKNLEDARQQATTEHFWIINEFCDYTNFDWNYDFDFLPDDIAWHGEHNNAWPSVHQKDSGTWLCPKEYTQHIIYRHDVEPLKRYVDMSNWVLLDKVDKDRFDFSWHPDPTDPPFIYKWGCKFYKSEFKHSLEYRTPGAFQEKWMPNFVELEPDYENIVEVQKIDKTKFDISWRPDPLDPLYIYIWGNKWIPGELQSTFEYHTPGATEKKYMKQLLEVLPEYDRWVEVEKVDRTTFDFTWRPDPREPPYIYVWGNKYYSGEFGSTIEYHTPGATEKKYMSNDVGVLPLLENFKVLQPVESFDFNWRPNPKEPPYIYVFGNQYYNAQIDPTIEYHTPGATEYKYINTISATLKADKSKFTLLHPIVESKFDFSWKPNPKDPPYIYVFGNQWHDAITMPTVLYEVKGATEYKYVDDIKAILEQNKENWYLDNTIDDVGFDYSWVPNPNDPEYIYEFGTQHQKTGGPRYIVEGAQEKKYIDIFKVKKLPNPNGFQLVEGIIISDFDFSWHPDSTEEPYIYVFGNNLYPAEIMPTIRYVVLGATEIKYVNDIKATLGTNLTNWIIPDDVDASRFDFTWVPNPKDPPYIYEFGTQHQKTDGPRYVVPNATEIKYVDSKVKALKKVNKNKFVVPNGIDDSDFDYSWHPDSTEQPFIYQFGTQHQKTDGPRYIVDGATIVKYVDAQKVKKLPNRENWELDKNLDVTNFDFSWHPDDTDEPYIYEFGTQWQKTGGPRYVVSGATQTKYITGSKAIKLDDKSNWIVEDNIKIKSFDFSWHPDTTEQSFIYVFGNNLYPAEVMPTIKYVVPGATEVKYVHDIVAILDVDMTNWIVPNDIDITSFDFSWVPNPKDPPYTYQFGTQWQKTGGPKYVVNDSVETKFIDTHKAKRLSNKQNWIIPSNINENSFDFSWHPDDTEPAYIYEFGTQWQDTGGPQYKVLGATEIKYVTCLQAEATTDLTNWSIPENIDTSTFDFSWHPNGKDDPYIYVFGTQWQKTGGPKYIVKGASETKFVDSQKATRLPDQTHWYIPDTIDVKDFDFSWHPDESEPDYIYEFGTQWQPNGGPRYIISGATVIKYVDTFKSKHKVCMDNWTVPSNIDTSKFDFSWHPDNTSEPYIYEFATVWNDRGGPVYNVDRAIEKKYITEIKAHTVVDKTYFRTKLDIEKDSFDYSWVPHPEAPPYIYVFGNQWNSAERETTIEYHVPGATEKKYINDIVARVAKQKTKFNILVPVLEDEFDFSWRPDPYDPPYIYVFGNTQYPAEIMPTIEYSMEGATEVKFVDLIKAKLAPNKTNYKILIPIVESEFDFSWVPNPKDPPYIYVFGNQHNNAVLEPTVEYHVTGATEYKYIDDIIAKVAPNKNKFKVLIPVEDDGFDFSWRPNPKDPPYIYVFGNQWHSAEKEPTIEYYTTNAINRKYINEIIATVADNYNNWEVNDGIDVSTFDFSWRPDPGSPPYIYQFGTLADDNDGPRYVHPDNTGETVRLLRVTRKTSKDVLIIGKNIPKYFIETTLEDLVTQHKNEIFWALNKNINYDNFDFTWRPSIEQARYVHVFGSPESELTQTYFVSGPMYKQGYTNFNFVEENVKADNEYLATLFKPSDVFFIDRGNAESNQRFEEIKAKFPKVIKTRYLGTWADTINRCLKRCETQLAWILNSELDYTDFDFKYYPNPWQMKMVHVFGTQWSHWGTTFMVNKDTFANDTKYIKIVEHLNNLNFVKNKPAKATNCLYDIYFIDHNNSESEEVLKVLEQKAVNKKVTTVKYKDSYLNTFKEILTKVEPAKDNYIWVASSICDYKDFDFSFICDPFAKDNLHVFPSDYQKFGDTFLVDVNKLQSLISEMNLLEDYGKVQYAYQQRAKRLPAPIIVVDEDTHRHSSKVDYSFPYAIFKTKDNEHIDVNYNKPLSLWSQETKNIEILSTGGSVLVLPQEVKNYVSEELYDYPYITKADTLQKSKPLDIVFLSNGETLADKHYDYLLRLTHGMSNRVVRVDGVKGRAQSYHAAAEASNTPWFFTVFAKLEVNSKFNFNWQPDRLQVPKHYIFNAINPVNGLIYGHQAMIAYNKKLVLNNPGRGLDFTLDDEHEVVDLLSGIARFNTDKFSTWRTAFREVIKLKSDFKDISYERLNIWLTKAEGDYAEDCLQGAKDAVEYYQSVNGDIEKLKLSYEWAWLSDYYKGKYK